MPEGDSVLNQRECGSSEGLALNPANSAQFRLIRPPYFALVRFAAVAGSKSLKNRALSIHKIPDNAKGVPQIRSAGCSGRD